MKNMKLLGLGVAFLLFAFVNQTYFGGVRLDLTENKLYTLSSGTNEVLAELDEPINFYFFFSADASRELTSLRSYANQVESLLKEYERRSNGKLRLQVIDPDPFSEDEDLAAEFGLQSVPIGASGEELYFGLAATNALDQEVILPFFQPDKEAFLEYDLSRAIQSLSQVELPTVGLMSSLKIDGDINMQTFESTPPWMVIEQLRQRYQVETVDQSATVISDDISLLVLVHPKALSDETTYALDQFVMRGGRLLVFVDPFAEMDRIAATNPMLAPQIPGAPSDFDLLLNHWGLSLEPDVVLGDADLGLSVGSASGVPVRHLAIIGLSDAQFNQQDIAIADVSSLNLSSAGIINIAEPPAGLMVQPLMSIGPYAAPISVLSLQTMSDPEELLRDFTPNGETYHIAARVSGTSASAFNESALKGSNHIAGTDDINVVVVADTDILTDRLWVQVQNFFGQRIADPFAGNGDFFSNMVDNLAGSSALISIRGRGEYSRPFHVVEDLRREAESKYLRSADALQAQLLQTETRLAELVTGGDDDLVSINPEQEAELLRFQQEKLDIRRQLREVRHQLDKDIEQLGTNVKFFNILLLPLLMVLGVMMIHYLALSGRARREQGTAPVSGEGSSGGSGSSSGNE